MVRLRLKLITNSCLIFFLLLPAILPAQALAEQNMHAINTKHAAVEASRPLSVGDKVPDIEFTLLNSPIGKARLSDFKGKLVILDFWATWCTSCIQSFPKMEALQEKFKDNLKVLLVNSSIATGDDEKNIATFFKNREKMGKKISLPTIVNDSVIVSLFEHKAIPHYVWISSDGKVMAITSGDYVKAENIETALSGAELKLPVKKDDFDKEKVLFEDGNEVNYVHRSLLTGYRGELPSLSHVSYNKEGKITRILFTNSSLIGMVEKAYPKTITYATANRIVLDVNDENKFKRDPDWETWKYDNTYCYELIVPPCDLDQARIYMTEDLNRFFGLHVSAVTRQLDCLVLTHNGKPVKAISKGGDKATNMFDENDEIKFIRNYPIEVLIAKLNNILKMPVLDESNFKQNLDAAFVKDLTELGSLRKVLQDYGFDLVKEKREIEVLVISNKSR
jgi:thiol-disulfide isomerase/thioredoxin